MNTNWSIEKRGGENVGISRETTRRGTPSCWQRAAGACVGSQRGSEMQVSLPLQSTPKFEDSRRERDYPCHMTEADRNLACTTIAIRPLFDDQLKSMRRTRR